MREHEAACRITVEFPDGHREVFASAAFVLIVPERGGCRVRQRLTTDRLPSMLAHFIGSLGANLLRAGLSTTEAAGQIGEIWRQALSEGLGHLGEPPLEFTGKACSLEGGRR